MIEAPAFVVGVVAFVVDSETNNTIFRVHCSEFRSGKPFEQFLLKLFPNPEVLLLGVCIVDDFNSLNVGLKLNYSMSVMEL